MENITVKAQEMTLDPATASDTNDITEFALYDDAMQLIEIKRDSADSPLSVSFTIDENSSYYYAIRQHGVKYGWGDWGPFCKISESYILAPDFIIQTTDEVGTILVSINPMMVYRGTDAAKQLNISIEDETGEKLKEDVVSGEPATYIFTGVKNGTYIVSAYWTGENLGDGDSANKEILLDQDQSPKLLAPEFSVKQIQIGFELTISLPLKTNQAEITDSLSSAVWILELASSGEKIGEYQSGQTIQITDLKPREIYNIGCKVTGVNYGVSPISSIQATTPEEAPKCNLLTANFTVAVLENGFTVNHVLSGNGTQLRTDCAGIFDDYDSGTVKIYDAFGRQIWINNGIYVAAKTITATWLTFNTQYYIKVFQKGKQFGVTADGGLQSFKTTGAGIPTLIQPSINNPSINGDILTVSALLPSGGKLPTTTSGVTDDFYMLEVAAFTPDTEAAYWVVNSTTTRSIQLIKGITYTLTMRWRGQRYSGSPWNVIQITIPK